MIHWAQPEWLGLLAVWAAAGWAGFALLRRRERKLAELIDASLWPALMPGRSGAQARRALAIWFAAGSCALAALARPQWGTRWEEVRRRGLQIVVALDTSNSMLASDLKPSRLQQAKWGLRDLVGRLRGDRIALLAFSGGSFVQCPMTIDYAAFLMTLDDVHAGIIPRGGTAIAQALRAAADAFDETAGGDKAIVLITDGEDHEGDPLAVIDELTRRNITVYTVGVGTAEGELIPDRRADGGFLRDRQGNVVMSALKEDALARLAIATGGAYVRAAPGDFGLDRIYEQGIQTLRREDQESRMARMREDRAGWFIGIALLLFLIEALRGHPMRRSLLRASSSVVAVWILLSGASLAPAVEADPRGEMRGGMKRFESGDFAEAAEAFGKAAEAAPDAGLDPARARYNEALALQHDEEAADRTAEAFETALRTTDRSLQARAHYNLGNWLAHRGESLREQNDLPNAVDAAEKSVAAFMNSLLLDPAGEDARRAYELTERRLREWQEELEQMPQQPQPQEGQESADRKEQQGESDPSDPSDPSESPEPSDPQPGEDDPSGMQDESPGEPGEAQVEQPPEDGPPPEPELDEMSEDEARMMLDALRDEEAAMRERMRRSLGRPVPVDKDW